MKHHYLLAIAISAVIAGFGVGVFAAPELRVPDVAPAYFVTLFDTESASEMMGTDYPSLAPATFQPFGGHYIIHSGRTISFDGQPPKQIVVIAFDSMERIKLGTALTFSSNYMMSIRLRRLRHSRWKG